MKKLFLTKLVLLFTFMVSPLFAYDCWETEDGTTECGDFIPPQYSQDGFVEYDKEGNKTKDVKRAPTPEEIAELERQKEEELRKQEQLKKDRELLSLFSTEKGIESARTAELSTIEGQVQSIHTILEGLKGNLIAQEESFQFSAEAAAKSEITQSQLDTIQRNIDSAKKRITDLETTLQGKAIEQNKINQKYDNYVYRFRDVQIRSEVVIEEKNGGW